MNEGLITKLRKSGYSKEGFSLPELIDACGPDFLTITSGPSKDGSVEFRAYDVTEEDEGFMESSHSFVTGKTAEEAMAKLWLKII